MLLALPVAPLVLGAHAVGLAEVARHERLPAGLRRMQREQPCPDAVHHRVDRFQHPRASVVGGVADLGELSLGRHEPVGPVSCGRIGSAPQPAYGQVVEHELQTAAAQRRVVTVELAVRVAPAGLVVDHHQTSGIGHVDPIDGTLHSQRPVVADLDGDGSAGAVGHPEAEFGRGGAGSAAGPLFVVEFQEPVEVGEDLPAVVVPVEASADEAPGGETVALLLPDRGQAVPPPLGPGLARSGHGVAVDGLGQPALQDPVHEAAALQRADAMVVVAVVDGVHSQDVAHQVAVGAGSPSLQTRRRRHLLAISRMGERDISEVAGGEVAVEPGQPPRQARPAKLDASLQLDTSANAGKT